MRRQTNIFANLDWITIILYFFLVFFGWLNIYSAVYNDEYSSIFDISQRYGKQLLWIFASVIIIFIVLFLDVKFINAFSYVFYAIGMLILLLVLFFGREVSGAKSWFHIGSFGLQPSEFAKFLTALALARYLSDFNTNIRKFKHLLTAITIIALPAALIFLQNDTGSALVFLSFFLVLYRDGLSARLVITGVVIFILTITTLFISMLYIFIGLAFIAVLSLFFIKRTFSNILKIILFASLCAGFSFLVDYSFEHYLSPYQQKRINVVIGKELDVKGAGYNVHQSKIAIGSGGFWGKGYLEGTQTKYDFVPEQDTDFIFCTVGEELGFAGSFVILSLFLLLLIRLINLAERQKSKFSRIYGYGVLSVLLFHFTVNIGMTIGLVPVIGIPLPFFSYGGSSLWAFTILLFIFIRLDAFRSELL
ncbi:MAG: rod shape-determining protein RodA [Bacteroidetes bacterium]|nr:rod shape-determining protein RodA [Bacteroidota bacterium]